MTLIMVALLWAALSLTFLLRLRVIMQNLNLMIRPGRGLLRMPRFDMRPIKHLIAWLVELLVLYLWYSLAGISIIAHLASAFCSLGLMIALRDREAGGWLESVQIRMMSMN